MDIFEETLEQFPALFVASKPGMLPKYDIFLTLTKLFFVPKPNQTSKMVLQDKTESFSLKKTDIANIYSDDGVGHDMTGSLLDQ